MLQSGNWLKPDPTIVLVLSGRHAYWSRWQGAHLDAEFIETVEEPAESKQATRCAWLADGNVSLHLIVDSALDVVDRVVAPDLQRGFTGSLRRIRLLRQLARENTEADLIKLPRTASDIACLARSIWPQHWAPWLQSLQNERVVFDSVQSATQLWLMLLTGRAQSGLMVVAGALHHQHLWIEQGRIRFSRIIVVESTIASAGLLDETLNHLVERLAAVTLDVYVVGDFSHDLAGLSGHAIVRKVFVVPPALAPVSSNAASEAVKAELPTGVVTVEGSLEDTLAVPRLLAACLTGQAKAREPGHSSWPMIPIRYRRMTNGIDSRAIRQQLRQRDARQLLMKRDHLNKLALSRRTTRLVLSIACTMALVAASEGVDAFRQRSDHLSSQFVLRQQILVHKEVALKVHSNPGGLSKSLIRAEYFYHVAWPTSADMLNLVSLAVDRSTTVELARMSWTRVPEAAQSAEVVLTSADNAGFRQSMPDAMTRTDTLRLQLAGYIDNGLPLRQRQQQLDKFVEQLQRQNRVDKVLVQVSPATRVAEGSYTEHSTPDFVLQVQVRAG
ncbi:MAG: hypothetical protein V3U76_11575 [Granulosicoccus sp.]